MKKDVNRYETVEIDKLIPYENNARTHSEEQSKARTSNEEGVNEWLKWI
jgi:hypothetical protein